MIVSLCSFDRLFLDRSFSWLNDPEIRFLTDTPVVTRDGQEAWYNSLSDRCDYLVWGVLAEEEPVGVCGIKHIDGTEGEYFGYIGEKKYWGKGVGREMLMQAESRALSRGLKRLCLRVLKTNERAILLYRKCGYSLDCSDDKCFFMDKLL